MAGFFKKALNVFVEFDEDLTTEKSIQNSPINSNKLPSYSIDNIEVEKFEKYFDNLFDKANFPGPDYYEFHKMMETLEVHIADEKARLSATFASLSIQGLTKQTLIETANKYKEVIEKDKTEFDKALQLKLNSEVTKRQNELKNLEEKILKNSELIQNLTKEISESQIQMSKLKTEVLVEQEKIEKNNNGYQIASKAIINKITVDIQKIQTTF